MAPFGCVGEQTVRLGFGLQCGRQCRQCSDEPNAPKAAKPLHEGKKEDGAERKNDGRKENIDRKDGGKGPFRERIQPFSRQIQIQIRPHPRRKQR